MKMIPILLFLFYNCESLQINPINSPLLPVLLGPVKIITHYHSFLHVINLKKIETQLGKLFANIVLTQESAKRHDSYVKWLQAEFILNKTYEKFTTIYSNNKRTKRGLINPIGSLYNSLFGLMDNDDRQKINANIKILYENQHSLVSQMETKTTILKNLITNLEDTIKVIDANNNRTISKINDIIVQEHIQDTINNINFLQNYLSNIENALLFAHLNLVHSNIITTNDINEIFEKLKLLYKMNEIPIFYFHYYLSLFKIQTFIEDTNLHIEILVPILKEQTYSLFKIIPLPYKNLTILPPLSYLILGEDEHTWINNEPPRLDHTYLSNDALISSDNCIIDVIQRRINTKCDTVPVRQTQSVIQTMPNGQILIIPVNPIEVKEKCTNLEVKILQEMSLITPNPNCTLWIDQEHFYMTPVVLPDSVTYLLPEPVMNSNLSSFHLENVPTTKLEELHQQLRNLKKISLQAPDLDPVSHSWITLYLVIIIIAILILLGLRYCYRRRRSNQVKVELSTTHKDPTPAHVPPSKAGGII